MATAQCFRCSKGYESLDPDDLAGDGKCEPCKEFSKRVAFQVDIEMSKKRLEKPVSRIREMFTEEQILKGEIAGSPRLNIKDLGIVPLG